MPKANKTAQVSGPDSVTNADISYAAIKQQLDDVLSEMQASDCSVDRAAELYEQALRYIVMLEKQLEQVENRVEKVRADFTARSGL